MDDVLPEERQALELGVQVMYDFARFIDLPQPPDGDQDLCFTRSREDRTRVGEGVGLECGAFHKVLAQLPAKSGTRLDMD